MLPVHPELPKQFRAKYQAGLSAILHGLEDGDKNNLTRGATLYEEFKNWVRVHMEDLSYPPK